MQNASRIKGVFLILFLIFIPSLLLSKEKFFCHSQETLKKIENSNITLNKNLSKVNIFFLLINEEQMKGWNSFKAKIADFFKSSDPQKVKPIICENTINGQMKLGQKGESPIISSCVKVNGQLKANNTVFKEPVEVNGTAVCSNCIFEEDVLIRGDGKLSHCAFKKDLEVLNMKITFTNCKATNVYITNPVAATKFYSQKVTVEKGSQIELIIFNAPGGKVYKSKDSVVSEVQNGIIKK